MKHTTLSACLFAGLVSATSLVLDAQPGPDYATRDLFTQGEFFIGCNYWAKNAGMYMWSRWRPDIVEKELEELAKNGVQVMRVFPLWPDFQPLTGDCKPGGSYRSFLQNNGPLQNWAGVDDEMVRRFRFFCDVAQKNDIKLIVGIVTGWMSGRQFVPSVFEEKFVLSDPDAIKWTTRFVKYFVGKMKDHPAIAAWDYGNECNCMGIEAQSSLYNWLDHIGMAIRTIDPSRPVVSGMHGLSTDQSSPKNVRENGEISDILCTHPYAMFVPGCGKEALNTMRAEMHPTAESILYRNLGGKPCFIEEIGNLGTSFVSDERSAAFIRCTLFSAWANDLKGCLWWCNSDQEVLDFPPYTLMANERELGLLRQDYSPKPVMQEMQAFQKFRTSLPFKKLPLAKTDAVIVLPEARDSGWIPGFGAYVLARQAGFNPTFAGAEHELPESKFYIVCSSESNQSYTYPAQRRFFDKAKAGATVFVLYCGSSRFTQLREQAGVKIDYCTRIGCERTFTLSAYPNRPITCSDHLTCRLLPGEAEVLGSTAKGEPIFTRFSYGKGTVILCNSPIDRAAIDRSDTMTGSIRPYYLVFREAMKIAGVKNVVEKGDCPFVCFTEHPAPDGSTIVMAINFESRKIECPIKVNGTIGRVWRGDSVNSGKIVLPANEAALFEVKR